MVPQGPVVASEGTGSPHPLQPPATGPRVTPSPGSPVGVQAHPGLAQGHLGRGLARASRVRDLVLLVSSSRSGSSVLANTLMRTKQLIMSQGETNPFFRLVGMQRANGPVEEYTIDQFMRLAMVLMEDLGFLVNTPNEDYPSWMYWRLRLQWPYVDLSKREVERAMRETLFVGETYTQFIAKLREVRHIINPHRYDLPSEELEEHRPPISAPRSILEEPPFVQCLPWSPATDDDLTKYPVVLKGPAEAYRIGFWREMFPNAKLRLLHLVRNPAAAINGLWDGWRSHNFHSCDLGASALQIEGYTTYDRRGSDRWWKFDQPDGWSDYARTPLADVCAFQWQSAHEEVLDYMRFRGADSYHRVAFEDIQDPTLRAQTLGDIFDWLGVTSDPSDFCRLPVVMATEPPRPGRWRERSELINGILPRLMHLAEELGYTEPVKAWV